MNDYKHILLLSILMVFEISNCLFADNERARINISDTGVKKNYMDIVSFTDTQESDYKWIIAGWDYEGGGIYEIDNRYLSLSNARINPLYEDNDKYLYSVNVLMNAEGVEFNNIILAGGYYSKCLCGVLLRKIPQKDYWEEVLFDDVSYPYVSNILCISTNVRTDSEITKYTRVFLGCTNGFIHYSDDNCVTFKNSVIYADNESIKQISFYNEKIGLALTGISDLGSTKLYKTTDGGLNWFLLKDFSGEGINLNDLNITPVESSDNIDFITMISGSKGSRGIIKTSVDFGENFIDAEVENYSGDSANLPGPIVSCLNIPNKANDEDAIAMTEDGILGRCEGDYPARFYFPFYETDDFPIGKLTKMKSHRNALATIGVGYGGLIYKFLFPSFTDVDDTKLPEVFTYYFDNIKQTLILDLKYLDLNKFEKLLVYNILGEKISEYVINTTLHSEFSLPSIPAGIYIFELKGHKTKKSGKFLSY